MSSTSRWPAPLVLRDNLRRELPAATAAAIQYYRRLGVVEEVVLANLAGGVRRSRVADAVGLTATAFSRYFQVHAAITFVAYVRALRAGYGKYLLLGEYLTLSELAWACGFGTERSLHRAFIQVYGLSPARVRRAVGPRSRPPCVPATNCPNVATNLPIEEPPEKGRNTRERAANA